MFQHDLTFNSNSPASKLVPTPLPVVHSPEFLSAFVHRKGTFGSLASCSGTDFTYSKEYFLGMQAACQQTHPVARRDHFPAIRTIETIVFSDPQEHCTFLTEGTTPKDSDLM